MSILNLKALKSLTKTAAPVEKTVKWTVEATDENIEQLKNLAGLDVEIGDNVELEGRVFIKKLSFKDQAEINKSFEFDFNLEDIESSKIKSINTNQLTAARLVGTVCQDTKGTPFFSNVNDVFISDLPFINALFAISDEVNNFMGKSRKKSLMKTNSGVSSSSTELVEEPLKKRKKE
ncbi:phage tail assembly chaperone family protein, TAC [Acinetobacter rudis]|uniref:phage tail assembly chaperone family protein, TAC n=1 Tax=Acinetobacter rudis TaxID=632955 RepID=UPI00333E64AB